MNLINIRRLLIWISVTAVVMIAIFLTTASNGLLIKQNAEQGSHGITWQIPDTSELPMTPEGMLVRYGRDLIANTSYYLGPKGTVAHITNGMNCQNCHLDAGTRTWGNNYGAVFSTYPKFRDRSGSIENIYKRVNDCLERSLNGHAIDTNGHEMQAIAAYLKWIGQKVPRANKPWGTGIRDLAFMDRPADPVRGRTIYIQKCQRCHSNEGSGLLSYDSTRYVYPPLWGKNSYNVGAGLYRLSRFAGYVRDNMPFDAPNNSAPLIDEEAWDVAAFVNSQQRPVKDCSKDYPNIGAKPVDYPFGPFKDQFSEDQHKYGPFAPIRAAKQK